MNFFRKKWLKVGKNALILQLEKLNRKWITQLANIIVN